MLSALSQSCAHRRKPDIGLSPHPIKMSSQKSWRQMAKTMAEADRKASSQITYVHQGPSYVATVTSALALITIDIVPTSPATFPPTTSHPRPSSTCRNLPWERGLRPPSSVRSSSPSRLCSWESSHTTWLVIHSPWYHQMVANIRTVLSRRSDNPAIPKWEKAVEGISGAAVIYTAFAVILTCFLGGITFFAFLAVFLDVLFCAAFIAIAVLARGGAKACGGVNNSPVGPGEHLSCQLERVAFIVAIIGA